MRSCAMKSVWISDMYLYSALHLGYHTRTLSRGQRHFWFANALFLVWILSSSFHPPSFKIVAFRCLRHPCRNLLGLLLNQLFLLHLVIFWDAIPSSHFLSCLTSRHSIFFGVECFESRGLWFPHKLQEHLFYRCHILPFRILIKVSLSLPSWKRTTYVIPSRRCANLL